MKKRVNQTNDKLTHLLRFWLGSLNRCQGETYRWTGTLTHKTFVITSPDGVVFTIVYRKTKWGDVYNASWEGQEPFDIRSPYTSYSIVVELDKAWRGRLRLGERIGI